MTTKKTSVDGMPQEEAKKKTVRKTRTTRTTRTPRKKKVAAESADETVAEATPEVETTAPVAETSAPETAPTVEQPAAIIEQPAAEPAVETPAAKVEEPATVEQKKEEKPAPVEEKKEEEPAPAKEVKVETPAPVEEPKAEPKAESKPDNKQKEQKEQQKRPIPPLPNIVINDIVELNAAPRAQICLSDQQIQQLTLEEANYRFQFMEYTLANILNYDVVLSDTNIWLELLVGHTSSHSDPRVNARLQFERQLEFISRLMKHRGGRFTMMAETYEEIDRFATMQEPTNYRDADWNDEALCRNVAARLAKRLILSQQRENRLRIEGIGAESHHSAFADPVIIRRTVEMFAKGKKVLLLTNDASVAIRSMGMCDDLQLHNNIDDHTWDTVYAPRRPMVMTMDDLKILDFYTRQYHFLQMAAGRQWLEDIPRQSAEKEEIPELQLWMEGFRPGDRHERHSDIQARQKEQQRQKEEQQRKAEEQQRQKEAQREAQRERDRQREQERQRQKEAQREAQRERDRQQQEAKQQEQEVAKTQQQETVEPKQDNNPQQQESPKQRPARRKPAKQEPVNDALAEQEPVKQEVANEETAAPKQETGAAKQEPAAPKAEKPKARRPSRRGGSRQKKAPTA